MKQVSTKFSKWLLDKGLSTADVAKLAKRSYYTVRSWRTGARKVAEHDLAPLAKALDLTPKQLKAMLP